MGKQPTAQMRPDAEDIGTISGVQKVAQTIIVNSIRLLQSMLNSFNSMCSTNDSL